MTLSYLRSRRDSGADVEQDDLGYRLRFKGVYEGLYDYGPEEYSDQVEVNPPSPPCG